MVKVSAISLIGLSIAFFKLVNDFVGNVNKSFVFALWFFDPIQTLFSFLIGIELYRFANP
jgi:hypothetical protein